MCEEEEQDMGRQKQVKMSGRVEPKILAKVNHLKLGKGAARELL